MTTTIFNNREVRNGEVFGGNRRFLVRSVLFGLGLFITGMLLVNVVRVTRIGAGYVGVEVNLAGQPAWSAGYSGPYRMGVLFAFEDGGDRVSYFRPDGEVDGRHQ